VQYESDKFQHRGRALSLPYAPSDAHARQHHLKFIQCKIGEHKIILWVLKVDTKLTCENRVIVVPISPDRFFLGLQYA